MMTIFNQLIDIYYVLIYIGIGSVITLPMAFEGFIEEYKMSSNSMIKAIRGKRSIKDRLLTPCVYFFSFIIFIAFWPIVLVFTIRDKLKKNKVKEIQERSHFYSGKEYLVQKLDPIDAEKNHQVYDPLGLTPNTPFGHLYITWGDFLAEFDMNDALWYFEIPRGSKTDFYNSVAKCDVKGYARVNSGKILGEFIFEGE